MNRKQGIYYLTKSFDGSKPHDLSTDPCWTNSVSQGVAIRTQWGAIEKSLGTYDWSYLDQASAAAIIHKKKWSILVTAGVSSPAWLKTSGVQGMMVNAGSGAILWMPLPWDTNFQSHWAALVRTMARRYRANLYLEYIVMGGFGRRAESYFVTEQSDIDTFHSLGGLDKWKSAVQWTIDLYASAFPNQFIILDLGAPEPTDEGVAALSAMCDYGSKYAGHFGVKSDGLAPNYGPNELGAVYGLKLSPTTLTGFQQGLPKENDELVASLDKAAQYGAHLVEVYSGVCDDPTQATILKNAAINFLQ